MLDLDIVPVVMGGGNYSRDAPEYSVIDVKDFPSAKALADYLTYLTRNPVNTQIPSLHHYTKLTPNVSYEILLIAWK